MSGRQSASSSGTTRLEEAISPIASGDDDDDNSAMSEPDVPLWEQNPEDDKDILDPFHSKSMIERTIDFDLPKNRRTADPTSAPPTKAGQASKTATSMKTTRRSIVVEMPLRVNRYGGFEFSTSNSRMHVQSTFPLHGYLQQWTATLGGLAVQRGSTGFITSQAGVHGPLTDHIRASLGLGTGARHHDVSLRLYSSPSKPWTASGGVSTRIGGSSDDWKRHLRLSLSQTHRQTLGTWMAMVQVGMPDKNQSALHQVLVSFTSRTRHWWNVGLGWTLQHPLVTIATRTLQWEAAWTWRGTSGWQLKTHRWSPSTTRKTSHWSCGVDLATYPRQKGLWTWLFSWSDGELTIRLPLLLGITQVQDMSLLLFFVQWTMTTGASALLHAGINRALEWDMGERKSADTNQSAAKEKRIELRDQARSFALEQQEVMRTVATRRTKQEEDKLGLVIRNAEYRSPEDSLDVTVPLQFWVKDSALKLPAVSKANSLGFYNLLLLRDEPGIDEKPKHDPSRSWLSGFWSRDDHESSVNGIAPKLEISYLYDGDLYSITVPDSSGLELPSPQAVLVKKAD